MSKFVNLSELRGAIERESMRLAEEAGIERPHVLVRIEPPDARGRRPIEVYVGRSMATGGQATTDEVAAVRGARWEDN